MDAAMEVAAFFLLERTALRHSLLYLMSVFFIARLLFMTRTSISQTSFTRMLPYFVAFPGSSSAETF